MHALHLGFGVGSLVVPQIADPFLAVLKEYQSANNDSVTKSAESNMAWAPIFGGTSFIQNVTTQRVSIANSVYSLHSNVTQTSILSDIAFYDVQNYTAYMFTTDVPTTVTANNSTNKIFLKETTVQWAYAIVAIVAFAVSIPFFCFQLCGKSFRDTKMQEDKTKDPKLNDPTLVSIIGSKNMCRWQPFIRTSGCFLFCSCFVFKHSEGNIYAENLSAATQLTHTTWTATKRHGWILASGSAIQWDAFWDS